MNLGILDDLMNISRESKQISKLFAEEARHKHLPVIFLVEKLVHHGLEMRTISLNFQYLVLYKRPSDKSKILYLEDKIFTENPQFLTKVDETATGDPRSYLLIEHHRETLDQYRVLSNIFPREQIRFSLPGSLLKAGQLAPRSSKEQSNISPLANTKKLFQGLLQSVPRTLSNRKVRHLRTQH